MQGDTEQFPTHQGVPQGSVLSPLLFNAAMAGLTACVRRRVRLSLYADDICIWSTGTSRPALRQRLQSTLDSIHTYLLHAGMEISAEKSAVVFFTRKDMRRCRLYIGGNPLTESKHHKFLGVTLTPSLSWKRHVDNMERRVNRWVSVLRHFAGLRWGRDEKDLLMLHNALVRGSLLYSLPVLHGLPPTLEQRIRAMLARSLRICLGVPRGAETRLVIAEARDVPVAVLRTNATAGIFLRLVAHHRRHPLIRKLQSRRTAAAYPSIMSAKQRAPKFIVAPVASSIPPWSLPSPTVSTTLPGMKHRKTEYPALVLKQLALDLLSSRYSSSNAVYTDGSSTSDSSSSAFAIPSVSLTRGYRLSHRTSSTSAELYAILLFLRYALDCDPQQWVVCTDSKAALQCIKCAGIRGSLAPIVTDILTQLKSLLDRGHTVAFQWVPGHCGIPGNHMADEAATTAHLQRQSTPIILSKGDRRSLLRNWCASLAAEQWCRDIPPSSCLGSVDPTLSCTFPSSLPRLAKALLHRMRLNVAFTQSYQFLLGRASSPLCSVCGVPGTLEHVLLACASHSSERRALRSQLDRLDDRPFNLCRILGPWRTPGMFHSALRSLVRFLDTTGLINTL